MKNKKNIIPLIILPTVAILWAAFFILFKNDFLNKYYFMPFLGILAATVANTTPAAAGIVYFPILTKLQIAPIMAARYNLMIQAYGMGLGTLKWYLVNKKLFLLKVIPACILGGFIGCFFSIVIFPLENPKVLQLIFSIFAFILVQFVFFSILREHKYPNNDVKLNLANFSILFFLSLIGGLISGWIGFGIDTIFYFILTIIFRINPAVSIITSISLMTGVSIFGTALNIIFKEIPLALWYSAIPGVTLAGLFIASFLALKLGTRNILLLFTLFLSLDFFLTIWQSDTIAISTIAKFIITHALVLYLLIIHIKIFRMSYTKIKENLGEFKESSS